MKTWKEAVVSPDTALADVIAKVNASGLQVALVIAEDKTLLGIVTDGNIRRAILAGKSLHVPISEVMCAHPTSVAVSTSRDKMLALMRRNLFQHLPLVNDLGQVVGLATLNELVGACERPNWVVIMAGGLGTRLKPLTDECPKPLLKIDGKPILEIILEGFAEQGFRRIFLAVNYKAEMVRNYFGDGERWGVRLEYLHENTRLGTAGALSLLPEKPTVPIIVMNGDLLTRSNFDNLLRFHHAHGATTTMAVREYNFQVPYGVVQLDDAYIKALVEKPVQRFFVNAGIYVLAPEALDHLPPQTFFDMPTLFEHLIAAGKITAAYPLREYWLDIGRLEEFERAQQEWVRDS